MSVTEIPFSQLVQHPKATVAKLEADPRRRLRLERRDGADLILESAERAEAEAEAVNVTTRLFMALISRDESARMVLLALPDVFPWVQFLPREDVQAFMVELVKTARACAELGNMAPLEPIIAAWRGTAEIHADPELRAAATAALDGTDYGAVPEVC